LKYFICALEQTNLGIPAEQTERIIPVTRVQDAVREIENHEVFISLPALLRLKGAAPHGIVLKPNVSAVKTTLLTPRIDAELEIPEEKIYSLPEILNGLFKYFRGAYCTDKNLILILDPEKLGNNGSLGNS
jgi:chemotaxis signal transduction protein